MAYRTVEYLRRWFLFSLHPKRPILHQTLLFAYDAMTRMKERPDLSCLVVIFVKVSLASVFITGLLLPARGQFKRPRRYCSAAECM